MNPGFTIIGAGGFVGRNLARSLRADGAAVEDVLREDLPYLGGHLGHVIYTVGLTADFRQKPFETVDAHVSVLAALLKRISYDSFFYLSTTRVYAGATTTAENAQLTVSPSNPDHLYNVSKLMGESLCLSQPQATCRVARLSNVIGLDDTSENFLTSVIAEAQRSGNVSFRTAADSARDFISIDDVCRLLPQIAMRGRARIYNVASGHNVSNGEIAQSLERLSGFKSSFAAGGATVSYPEIDTSLIRNEFGFEATPFEASLKRMLPQGQRA